MKKLLSLILAMLMFALPCMAEAGVIGGADGPMSLLLSSEMITGESIYQDAIDAGRRVTFNVTVPELTGVTTGDPNVDKAILDFVKALGMRVVTQGEEYDMGLSLSGKDVLTMGLALNGDDAYIKSNLIGGTIVLSAVEVEPIITRLLDMLVLMGAFAEEDAAEMKAQLPTLVETIKTSAEQSLGAAMNMEDLANMDFSAFDAPLQAIRVEEITDVIVPRMCDMATAGIRVTIDNETFVGLIRAFMQCIKDNPKFMDAIAASGSFPTEESRAAAWAASGELYMMFGWYESEEEYNAANPTFAETVDMAIAELEGKKLLDGDFVTSVYFSDEEEIVYLTSVLPMFTEGVAMYEADPSVTQVSGTTETLNVVYTRQTVAQGVSHVCNIDVDGEGITVDVLAQEKAWTINMSNSATQEIALTINAVEEDGVIKGDFNTYAEGLVGTFSFFHVADETLFKTDIAFSMWLNEEYLAAHPNEKTMSLAIGYTCDYARNGVDFSGKEIVNFAFNDVKFSADIDIATSDPVDSIMAGAVTRPAELDDSAFANWFVGAYNALNSWLANLITSLPESVLTMLIQSGMFG